MADFEYNPPMEPYLDILYEDSSIIVVNKPSGILSVPGKEERYNDSILTRIQKRFPLAAAAHRLDMSTSGILVVPVTHEKQQAVSANSFSREPSINCTMHGFSVKLKKFQAQSTCL